MRCPKCGFISFDKLSSCGKCSKPISLGKLNLNGMVYAVVPPNYLSGEHEEYEDSDASFDETVAVDDDFEADSDLDFDQTTDEDFDLEQDDFTLDTDDDLETDDDLDIEMDLNEFEDSSSSEDDLGVVELEAGGDDFDLEMTMDEDTITPDFALDGEDDSTDLGSLDLALDDDFGEQAEISTDSDMELDIKEESSVEDKSASPDLDFGDIDISDLEAPSEQEGIQPNILDEVSAPSQSKQSVEVNPDGADLEDMQMGDLGLANSESTPSTPQTKTSAKGSKTGTALDDFEIDLGDLISND
ncbi:MAG: hypothetical protein OEM02_09515 [Desulfobulbaceae bacterium]|nr:hypothetical protein [Desulfobulbaceae bacterium]